MEIPMNEIVEILEGELENAVEIKDRKSLHRYVVLMVDTVVGRKEYESSSQRMEAQLGGLRSDVALIAERMEQGFARMDERFSAIDRRFEDVNKRFDDVNRRFDDVNKRFDDVNKRFDDVNKRFAMLVGLTSTFFVVLAGMMTALRIFG
ncbi:MAG: hypothetical protein EA384_06220 [Spirochaetaceae bacterium]|nr:MAG: hypothetical protein EA384_06220 [Spirochaetaceae bacterium]